MMLWKNPRFHDKNPRTPGWSKKPQIWRKNLRRGNVGMKGLRARNLSS